MSATRHDRFVCEDYERMSPLGIRTVREGIRWPVIETERDSLNFDSVRPFLRAAREKKIEIIWDILHFGWPDFHDIFTDDWVKAFARLAGEFARLLRKEGAEPFIIAPVNEISFVAWAGGDVAYLNPFERGRGPELKAQLVRAFIAAAREVRNILPNVTLVSPEPAIHIVGDPNRPDDVRHAEEYRRSMFESWDMLLGRAHPELGGGDDCIDMIGVNYYDRNQWWNFGRTITRNDPEYRPFSRILEEIYDRYRLPMFISETGTEGDQRSCWFAYIAQQVREAIARGVPVKGICLYPILNHPGWDDDRHCYNGLWDYPSDKGERDIYAPLAEEIIKQEKLRISEGKTWELN